MSLNIFYGGDDYDLSAPATGARSPTAAPRGCYRLAKIIEASGADVVGVQEPERNTRKLADLLGWYASPQAHVISRFPVLDPPDADGLFAYVMPVPGRVVAVSNVHLPSTPYGPYQVRKGWPRSKVLELERTPPPAGPAPRAARAARAGEADAGLPHRRLQQSLTPRLDAGGGRQPARGPVRRRVAGEQGSRRGWVRRLLPRRPPRPGGRPRLHLVARAAPRRRTRTSSTASTGSSTRARRPPWTAGWSASAATRRSTSPSPSRSRPTTAVSCRPST